MPNSMRFEFDFQGMGRVRRNFSEAVAGLPDIEDDVSRDVADMYATEIRRRARLEFGRGRLSESIKVRRSGRGTWVVDANARNPLTGYNYAAWHELADKGHFVSPFNHTELLGWAEQRFGSGNIPHVLFVRPTKFVKPAARTAYRKLEETAADSLEEKIDEIFEGGL